MHLTIRFILAASALSLAACQPPGGGDQGGTAAAPAAEAPTTGAPVLTAEGWGPLRIGMTRAEVTEAVGTTATPDAVSSDDPEACDQFQPQGAPEGLYVMLEQGVLTRISISEPSTLRTDRGFGIGSTGDEVKAAYGAAAVVEPHRYVDPPAEYITVWNGGAPSQPYVEDPAARGISYETGSDGHVIAISVGGPAIQYVEGCA